MITHKIMVAILAAAVFGVAQQPVAGPRSTAVPATLSIRQRSEIDSQIRRLLEDQVTAWNQGDLEGFMQGYWHSPELTFFSNGSATKGWEPALARYKQRYQSGGHAMGKLDFQELAVTPLCSDAAFVRGQFHLVMADGKEPHGMFTLVLRRFPTIGWKIVHDHTSAAD